MRLAVLVVLALAGPAFGDGAYVSTSLGGVAHRGDLARFDDSNGTPNFQLGIGFVRGPWAVEVFRSRIDLDLFGDAFYTDCYGEECTAVRANPLGLTEYGIDLRRAWLVVRPRWTEKVHLDFVLHGGPRVVAADQSLAGYRGLALGGGAALDLNIRWISIYLDFTTALVELQGDGESYVGSLPSVMYGLRFGWM